MSNEDTVEAEKFCDLIEELKKKSKVSIAVALGQLKQSDPTAYDILNDALIKINDGTIVKVKKTRSAGRSTAVTTNLLAEMIRKVEGLIHKLEGKDVVFDLNVDGTMLANVCHVNFANLDISNFVSLDASFDESLASLENLQLFLHYRRGYMYAFLKEAKKFDDFIKHCSVLLCS